MTWIEVGAFVVIALAVVDGAYSGFVWAVLELTLLAIAALLTGALSPHVEDYMIKAVDVGPPDLAWVTHTTVFAMVAVTLLGALFLLHPTTERWRFRHDRWLGGVTALATGLLATFLAVALATWITPRSYDDVLKGSVVVDGLQWISDGSLSHLFPPDLHPRLAALANS